MQRDSFCRHVQGGFDVVVRFQVPLLIQIVGFLAFVEQDLRATLVTIALRSFKMSATLSLSYPFCAYLDVKHHTGVFLRAQETLIKDPLLKVHTLITYHHLILMYLRTAIDSYPCACFG